MDDRHTLLAVVKASSKVVEALVLCSCEAITDSGETEYSGTASGPLMQVIAGNMRTRTVTHSAIADVKVKVKREGNIYRGGAEILITTVPLAVAGDTAFCRLGAVAPLASYWGRTEVSGPANDLQLSDSHSEINPGRTAEETLSFRGAVAGDVLTGTMTFHRINRSEGFRCPDPPPPPGTPCTIPQTTTMTESWNITITARSQ